MVATAHNCLLDEDVTPSTIEGRRIVELSKLRQAGWYCKNKMGYVVGWLENLQEGASDPGQLQGSIRSTFQGTFGIPISVLDE